MFPLLTNPLALIALIGIPSLAAIYLLRNRYKTMRVSSLLLWEHQRRAREGGKRIQRMQTPIPFLLELLAIILLVIAAIDPRWSVSSRSRPLVVVLDNSASMTAEGAGGTARKRAASWLGDALRSRSFHSVRFVLAGNYPQLIDTPENADPAVLAQALKGEWTCSEPAANLGLAVTHAADIGGERASILVLTDHKPDEVPKGGRIKWRAFGGEALNAAFVNAARSMVSGKDRCLLEISNLSTETIETTITMKIEGLDAKQGRKLTLRSGEKKRQIFEFPTGSGKVVAELTPDAMEADNKVILLPPSSKRVRVQVNVKDESAKTMLTRAIAASGLRSTITKNPQLIITDKKTAVRAAPDKWVVRIISGRKPSSYVGPFLIDRSHELAKGLTLDGVIWAAAETNINQGIPVIMAGNVPLVTAEENVFGSQTVNIQLNPSRSTLQLTPAWPSLMWNLMEWRAAHLAGARSPNCRVGGNAEVVIPAGEEDIEIVFPDGRRRKRDRTREISVPCDQAGLYRVKAGNSEYVFAANFLAADESDLSEATEGEWGEWQTEASVMKEFRSSAWIFLLCALAVLSAHLAIVTRRRGSE